MEGQFENNGNLCAPQEDYRKPMRKAYCRVEWKIFLYAVIVVAAQTLYAWALPELFGESVYVAEWFTWGMMIIPMYMIAFPVLYLLIGGKKDRVKIMQHCCGAYVCRHLRRRHGNRYCTGYRNQPAYPEQLFGCRYSAESDVKFQSGLPYSYGGDFSAHGGGDDFP